VFGRRGIVRSYVPIIYLACICLVAVAIGDTLGAILTIIGVIAWTTIALMLIYMFLFKDFLQRIKDDFAREDAVKVEVEDEVGGA